MKRIFFVCGALMWGSIAVAASPAKQAPLQPKLTSPQSTTVAPAAPAAKASAVSTPAPKVPVPTRPQLVRGSGAAVTKVPAASSVSVPGVPQPVAVPLAVPPAATAAPDREDGDLDGSSADPDAVPGN